MLYFHGKTKDNPLSTGRVSASNEVQVSQNFDQIENVIDRWIGVTLRMMSRLYCFFVVKRDESKDKIPNLPLNLQPSPVFSCG